MIMCNNDEFIKLVTDYVLSVLDEKVTLVPLEKCISDTIPIAVTQSFNLYKVEFLTFVRSVFPHYRMLCCL